MVDFIVWAYPSGEERGVNENYKMKKFLVTLGFEPTILDFGSRRYII